MALIKMKPTSPGTRFVVKIDRSHLHKGGPLESLTTQEEPHRRAQPLRPHTTRHIGGGHKQLPPDRLQARQGRHSRRRRAPRIRSEPHRAYRADAVRGRRAPLHPRAQGREGRRRDPLRRRCPDQGGQRAAAAPHPGRHDRAQHRDEARARAARWRAAPAARRSSPRARASMPACG